MHLVYAIFLTTTHSSKVKSGLFLFFVLFLGGNQIWRLFSFMYRFYSYIIYDISCAAAAAAIQIDAQILRFKNGKFSLRPTHTHTHAHIKKGNRQKYFICSVQYYKNRTFKNATPSTIVLPAHEKEPFVYLNVCFFASCALPCRIRILMVRV